MGGSLRGRTDEKRDARLLVPLSTTSSLEMEIPPEQQQVLTLTLTVHTNMSSRHRAQSRSDDRCVCLTRVPVLPQSLFVLGADSGETCSSCWPAQLSACKASPDRSVYKWLREEVLRCVCVCAVYTFASMILVLATSRGVVTNAATAPTEDTYTHLAKCFQKSLSE